MSAPIDPHKVSGGGRLQRPEQRVEIEKVNNVWGSTAGAGSDFFHVYRKHRRIEMDRLKKMDEDWEAQQETEEMLKRKQDRERAAETERRKKAQRRHKRKENKERAKELKKTAETMNQFKNDGSFLDQVLADAPAASSTDHKRDSQAAENGTHTSPADQPPAKRPRTDDSSAVQDGSEEEAASLDQLKAQVASFKAAAEGEGGGKGEAARPAGKNEGAIPKSAAQMRSDQNLVVTDETQG
ncbi:unnamed protein product [Vitrella brassicaformis CCMP3155]|uniref:Uncharacterized protein n=2 Tax=Vitrella brassicaformis TaxID=1169539 RepID=A0A0G4FHF5_VITBC|nr:unnamed protein product [Vitrella brassicaformis CCMP3155]|eukprot:CEM12728.1 unnamed protein product [Vitrella brassicaformis CCMP3155]